MVSVFVSFLIWLFFIWLVYTFAKAANEAFKDYVKEICECENRYNKNNK